MHLLAYNWRFCWEVIILVRISVLSELACWIIVAQGTLYREAAQTVGISRRCFIAKLSTRWELLPLASFQAVLNFRANFATLKDIIPYFIDLEPVSVLPKINTSYCLLSLYFFSGFFLVGLWKNALDVIWDFFFVITGRFKNFVSSVFLSTNTLGIFMPVCCAPF